MADLRSSNRCLAAAYRLSATCSTIPPAPGEPGLVKPRSHRVGPRRPPKGGEMRLGTLLLIIIIVLLVLFLFSRRRGRL
jgi:hypothetical protein